MAEVDEELPEEVPVLCVVPWVVFPSGSVGVLELPPPPPPQETDGRGPGISAFSLKAENSNEIIERAQNLGFMVDDKIIIGGVKFYLK